MATKILLAEDDLNLGMVLQQYLEVKGFDVDLTNDGEAAYQSFLKNKYDLCILDIMMPKKDGFTLAEEILKENSNVPIVFLTAKTLKEDVLHGLKIGADDYIVKPFNMEELLLRIEAILRRSGKNDETDIFKIGQYTFDANKQILRYKDKEETTLTTKEAELLKMLCQNMNKTLERHIALKNIWQDDNYFNARSMDVYITKLRKHLKNDPNIEIKNVHGRGYKLIVE